MNTVRGETTITATSRGAKRLAWERFLAGLFPAEDHSRVACDPERCWKALRYTKPQVPSYTPAIRVSGVGLQPDKIAATAEGKEETFIAQAFPSQASNEENTQIPDTNIRVSACQVREAYFAQSIKKAPGADVDGFQSAPAIVAVGGGTHRGPHPGVHTGRVSPSHVEDCQMHSVAQARQPYPHGCESVPNH